MGRIKAVPSQPAERLINKSAKTFVNTVSTFFSITRFFLTKEKVVIYFDYLNKPNDLEGWNQVGAA
jgi:hypothetical protein